MTNDVHVSNNIIAKSPLSIIAFILTAFFVFITTYFFQSPEIHLYAILFLVFVSILISRFNILDPFFWFSISFFLYSCGYLIIVIFFPDDRIVSGYSKINSYFTVLFLFALIITVLPKRERDHVEPLDPDSLQLLKALNTFFLIATYVSYFILSIRGISSKVLQLEESNELWILVAYCSRFLSLSIVFIILSCKNTIEFKIRIILSLIIILIFSFSAGERDAFFRYCIVVVLSLYATQRIKRWHLFALIPLSFFIFTFSSAFKYFFTQGISHSVEISSYELLYEFIYGDFVEIGSNLQLVVDNFNGAYSWNPIIFFYDVISVFVPSSVLNYIAGGLSEWNLSVWFNQLFYYKSSYYHSFSIIAEGYIVAGQLGVLAVVCAIMFMIRFLYSKSDRSIYYLAIYIYSIPAFIGSFRGTLGGLLQNIIRVPLTFIILMFVAKAITSSHHSKEVKDS